MKIRLCYRIEKSAGCGQDKYSNPTEVYSCVKVHCTTYNMPKNKYKKYVREGRRIIAAKFKIDEKLIVPITLNEYLDQKDEEQSVSKNYFKNVLNILRVKWRIKWHKQ